MKTCQNNRSKSTASGFTLVELLVVIIIITLVISIVVPTLGKARRATRVTVTRQLATNLVNAASTFQASERRWPGKFSPRDMGSDENGKTLGLSAMENVMLDLAGGIVLEGDPGAVILKGAVKVAPFTTASRKSEIVYVDPALIGNTNAGNATSKGYFSPPAKNFVSQVNTGADTKQFGTYGTDDAGKTAKTQLPDLVDEFGTPILVWNEDETAGPIKFDSGTSGSNSFARFSSLDINKPAHFYWASNAAFLNSNSLGKIAKNQQRKDASATYSLLGGDGTAAPADAIESLTGVLGNPGFAAGISSTITDPKAIIPSGSRGRFIVHTADPDGYYFSSRSKGTGELNGTGVMRFGFNYLLGTTIRKDDKGQQTNTDITAKFEDILISSGS